MSKEKEMFIDNSELSPETEKVVVDLQALTNELQKLSSPLVEKLFRIFRRKKTLGELTMFKSKYAT